ncbi:uroporphyrinogen-III C-methyltransferase [Lonepinella sp. BR2271]|uniref:uroporphyrinogen-III C-methyltransferase n=1 Tax=Lonepinella sp. BR2271 TaxID=3434550 RepID=UPI003F6E273A
MSNKKANQSDAVETQTIVEKEVENVKQAFTEKADKKAKVEPVLNSTQADANNAQTSKKDEKQSVTAEPTTSEPAKSEPVKTETVVVKKGGSAMGLLALLVALGLGGAGYYFGQLEVDKINQKVTALEQKISGDVVTTANNRPSLAEMPNFEQERAQLENVLASLKANDQKLASLEQSLSDKDNAYSALKDQVNKLANNSNAQPSEWLLSEADFLLTNALRKLLLDNDIDTSIALLKVADEVLTKVDDPQVKPIRTAINQDLKQLLSVNSVDQNTIMQRLSQLANNVDELVVANVNFGDEQNQDSKISDDVNDWEKNIEKSATSFLNHFIRITPRAENTTQALLAPNQDIYLRENIRLRLQIAILAVPRQQNELYKQSLETVAAWIRSYFDTHSETATTFLKSLDELADQSIYVEVPNQLSSLTALDKLLNKTPPEVQKIEISADKALTESNQVAVEEMKSAEQNTPQEPEKAAEASSETPTNTDEKPANTEQQ